MTGFLTEPALTGSLQTGMSIFLRCEHIVKVYGESVVLPGVSLEPPQGGVTALLGASGCGKTTLLNILAGFVRPDSGEVTLRGRICSRPGPDRGVVFQDSALFPWLDARDNVALGLRAGGASRKRAADKAEEWLERVGLADCAERFPAALSGGQRQRVALARALALEPEVLLMDEPFAALDAMTREQMQILLASLQERLHMTVLLVTHDMAEACLLADVALVMGTGRGIVRGMSIRDARPRDMTDSSFAANLTGIRRLMSEAAAG